MVYTRYYSFIWSNILYDWCKFLRGLCWGVDNCRVWLHRAPTGCVITLTARGGRQIFYVSDLKFMAQAPLQIRLWLKGHLVIGLSVAQSPNLHIQVYFCKVLNPKYIMLVCQWQDVGTLRDGHCHRYNCLVLADFGWWNALLKAVQKFLTERTRKHHCSFSIQSKPVTIIHVAIYCIVVTIPG